MTIKKDWWLYNAIIWFVMALVGILGITSGGVTVVFKLSSIAITFLVGLALLRRSRIVFWIVLALSSFYFVDTIYTLIVSKQIEGSFLGLPLFISIVRFGFALMLWQQRKKEGKIAVK